MAQSGAGIEVLQAVDSWWKADAADQHWRQGRSDPTGTVVLVYCYRIVWCMGKERLQETHHGMKYLILTYLFTTTS